MNKRKQSLILIAIVIVVGLAALAGCSRASDACATQYCQHGGSCTNGNCGCPGNFTGQHCDSCKTGYEGADCSTPSRNKFLYQNYNVSETVTGSVHGSRAYRASILYSPSQPDQVSIQHLSNGFFLNGVAATCRGNNLTIPYQQPDTGSPQYISGSGSYGTDININYTIIDSSNGTTYNCSGTWTR